MIPPSLLRLQLNSFRLWLPLFLLWPLALLLAPFVLLAGLIARKPFRLVVASYELLCALRGLNIDIDQPDNCVQIKFI